ncbi:MAG: hypothetical protein R3C69_02710 [Geminicoccaceae bacterium]
MFDEPTEIGESVDNLRKDLEEIDTKTEELKKYELATHLETKELRDALETNDQRGILAARLLESYVKSVKTRLNAVEQTYQLIDKFVFLINSFLRMKEIIYTVTAGFSIVSKNGISLPNQVIYHLARSSSSTIFLFYHNMTRPSIFIIDRHEISLNIKWQRNLLLSPVVNY